MRFSRFPIQSHQILQIPDPSLKALLGFKSKNVAIADLQVSSTRMVRVIGVHLPSGDQKKQNETIEIIQSLNFESELPILVAGDFNCGASLMDAGHASPSSRPLSAVDLLLKTRNYQTMSSGGNFPSWNPKSEIDWILIPAKWGIIEQRMPSSEVSDHLPKIMTVKIQ